MDDAREHDQASVPPALPENHGGNPPWELIENGRYRPRRIRGSLLGRELG